MTLDQAVERAVTFTAYPALDSTAAACRLCPFTVLAAPNDAQSWAMNHVAKQHPQELK